MDLQELRAEWMSKKHEPVRRVARSIAHELPRCQIAQLHDIQRVLEESGTDAEDPMMVGYKNAIVDLVDAFGAAIEPRTHDEQAEQLARRFGWYEILSIVRAGPARPGEVAARLGKNFGQISRTMREMRSAGLLEVWLIEGHDGRVRPHRLTPRGERVTERLEERTLPGNARGRVGASSSSEQHGSGFVSRPLRGSVVIGGLVPARGDRAFARGSAVLSTTGDSVLIASSYSDDGKVLGQVMGREVWDARVRKGQALALDEPIPAQRSTAVWCLRQNLEPQRDEYVAELRKYGLLLSVEDKGGAKVCVVLEEGANALRDRWVAAIHRTAEEKRQVSGPLLASPEAATEAALAEGRPLLTPRTRALNELTQKYSDNAWPRLQRPEFEGLLLKAGEPIDSRYKKVDAVLLDSVAARSLPEGQRIQDKLVVIPKDADRHEQKSSSASARRRRRGRRTGGDEQVSGSGTSVVTKPDSQPADRVGG